MSISKRLKELANSIPEEGILHAIMRVLEDATVRADYPLVIMGSAMVERALAAAIKSRFVPLDDDATNKLFAFNQNGALAELGVRVRVASAMGLFGPETTHDLETITHIRNLFAHAASLRGFDDVAVADACRSLNISKTERDDRARYRFACAEISARLKYRIEAQAEAPSLEFPIADGLLP